MWASTGGHGNVVSLLLESGADLRARTTGRFTALMFAARAGNVETVGLLLDAGADIEAESLDGSTPLLIASRSVDALASIDWKIFPDTSGHEETALYLIDRGADVFHADRIGRTALHCAAETRRTDLVTELLKAGADVNARFAVAPEPLRGDYLSRAAFKGATAFWLAAKVANVELMRALVAGGADVNLPNAYETSPLMVAAGVGENDARRPAEHRSIEVVRMLLELGVDVKMSNGSGQTALHGATAMAENRLIRFLVAQGADLDVEDRRGRTPLYIVLNPNDADAGYESTIALLRSLGAAEPVFR